MGPFSRKGVEGGVLGFMAWAVRVLSIDIWRM